MSEHSLVNPGLVGSLLNLQTGDAVYLPNFRTRGSHSAALPLLPYPRRDGISSLSWAGVAEPACAGYPQPYHRGGVPAPAPVPVPVPFHPPPAPPLKRGTRLPVPPDPAGLARCTYDCAGLPPRGHPHPDAEAAAAAASPSPYHPAGGGSGTGQGEGYSREGEGERERGGRERERERRREKTNKGERGGED